MGETQIYSQRLHGITEKRRILGEVDRIERELELQKLKLQQLKRKSLRDRWLMDGLVPAPGAEVDNPLSETEDKIKNLEDELENLQLQLVYLENPELKIENLKKNQGSSLQRQLVNGDQSQQISDQKDPTSDMKDIQKEHKAIQEEDLQANGEDEKQQEVDELSQKDPTPSKDVVVGQSIPAPRGIKVSGNDQMDKNEDQTSPNPKLELVDQINETEQDEEIQEKESRNVNDSLGPQDDVADNLGQNPEVKDESLKQEHVYRDQDQFNQNSECLDKRLEIEEDNVEHLTKELEQVDVSKLSRSNEDIRHDLDNPYNLVKVTLLDKSDLHESEKKPSSVMDKQYADQDEPLESDYNSQGLDEKPTSGSVIQDQNEEVTVAVVNEDKNEEAALPKCQVETAELVPVLRSHDKGQDLESTSFPVHQSLVLLSTDQEQSTKLQCNDPDLSVSLPCKDLVGPVQISQVVVISTPGHASSQQAPSSEYHQPGTTEANPPAESQPLMHKPPETDAESRPHGSNTADTRDKSPPVKKKSCQCCVVM
ncbi:paralemmin-3 isoform X2 [Rhinoderma darwinii]